MAPSKAPSRSITPFSIKNFNSRKITKYITEAAEAVKKGFFLSIFLKPEASLFSYYEKNLSIRLAGILNLKIYM